MSGNTFGTLFRITTFGESHGAGLGVVIDGCPAQIPLAEAQIQQELDRRRPGQSTLTSPRNEADTVSILSGVFEGQTTGAPIALLVKNMDARPEDYEHLRDVLRPSHADFTYEKKFGVRDFRGGGRASARETAVRVAAGAVARAVLTRFLPEFECLGFVTELGGIQISCTSADISRSTIEQSLVRCPDANASAKMESLIETVRAQGDSLGGIISCTLRGLPIGLGEPVFDRFHADLAKAMMSIPAVKGIEIGDGFAAARKRGSEHNDAFEATASKGARPATNHAGGVLGGMTTGAEVLFRVAFKPTATIRTRQSTVTTEGKAIHLEARGRHDPCVLPRAVPIVEAMALLVTIDHFLRYRAVTGR